MKFGCHVSAAGGVFNAPGNAQKFGCEVFQMFTRPPQGGKAPELTPEIVAKFKAERARYGYTECTIHAPYFINFGSSNSRIYHGSIAVIRQELERASVLEIPYVIMHAGSYKDLGEEKGFRQVVAGLEKVFVGYRGSAQLLLENSAGSGEVIGDVFEELSALIDHHRLRKYHLGTCFDTAHAFASGYDLRTEKSVKDTFVRFDKIVGLDNLKAIHANDSKFDFQSRRDRHEHIGKGKIGVEGFRAMIHHPKLKDINMYLETEHDLVMEDIKVLKGLRDR